jgi:hypothetical protein
MGVKRRAGQFCQENISTDNKLIAELLQKSRETYLKELKNWTILVFLDAQMLKMGGHLGYVLGI